MTDVTTDSSAVDKTSSGQPSDTSGDDGIKNQSAFEAKQKQLLAEVKKEREARRSLEAKLAEAENVKMQADGKKDELITKLNEQLRGVNSELGKIKATYAVKTVQTQVKQKAAELGCVDTELLLKAIDLESLSVVDDEFNVDQQSLAQQMEKIRKDKSYLFKQAGPTIKDGVPVNQPQIVKDKTFAEMSLEDLKKMARGLSDAKT